MKVLHVIPNAFEYFEDIHSEAFKLLEAEGDLGVEADAVTVEYGGVSKKEISEVKKNSSNKYIGQESFEKNIDSWELYDIINLHCPFFGSVGKILDWIQKHPKKFLVITYHYDFETPDFFGYFIKLYNYFYLPKLFKAASIIAFFEERYDLSRLAIKMIKNDEKTVVLGLHLEDGDNHNISIAEDLVMVYNSLMFK